jgi:outer membrane biosynthesis protein TonB
MNPALMAAAVSLMWDPSPDAIHYNFYVGLQSMAAGNPPLVVYPVPVLDGTTFEVTGLDFGTEYFFVVTALDAAEAESGYSNEVQYTPMPTPTPTPEPIPTPEPTPTPLPTPEPTPEPTPDDGEGLHKGWYK